jgi:hypothetical protein
MKLAGVAYPLRIHNLSISPGVYRSLQEFDAGRYSLSGLSTASRLA